MKSKFLPVALVVIVVTLLTQVAGALASAQPVYAMDGLYSSINAGDMDAAVDMFAEDAIAHYVHTDATYEGDAIADMLDVWHVEGRTYDIVSISMEGNSVEIVVDIADNGIVWGQQTTVAVVEDGLIQSLELTSISLQLWRAR